MCIAFPRVTRARTTCAGMLRTRKAGLVCGIDPLLIRFQLGANVVRDRVAIRGVGVRLVRRLVGALLCPRLGG